MITRTSADNLTRVEEHAGSPVKEESTNTKPRRFSMIRSRHASDSHLSTRARLQAQADAPALPHRMCPYCSELSEFTLTIIFLAPAIVTTAPTMDINQPQLTKKRSRVRLPGRKKNPADEQGSDVSQAANNEKKLRRLTMSSTTPSGDKSRVTFDEPQRPATQAGNPPAYGDEGSSTLALPVNRLSESSRSDASSGEHGVYATTTTTTHTIHTTTTFFRLPRRKKTPASLFDLSHLPQKSNSPDPQSLAPPVPPLNTTLRTLGAESPAVQALRKDNLEGQEFLSPLASPSRTSPAKSSAPVPLLRHGSSASTSSSPRASKVGLRGRSSTLSSLRNVPSEEPLPTPTLTSARTSTSTSRKSLGDLFGLSNRLRQISEPSFPRYGSGPATPASSTSKNNSIQLSREPIVLPERYEDDTPAKYLVRLEEAISRGVVASVLCKGNDPFSQAVLRSYMRGFGFFGDPMDMAIRKLLMEVELPKETQHIDRCLQGFANRYHECNPGIYASPDQAYFIAFSLLILHTDVFNKNNKHKMQKADYLKNTRGEGIFDEILECFYDNISYTPFIHVEDDLDINGERIIPHKAKKKSKFPLANVDPTKRPSKEPVDPYTLIIDSKLDTLRPNLKDVMELEEHYSYLGTATSLNLENLQKTFFRTGILQIISARSRPDAFMSEQTVVNPEEAGPGIVDIKITKVGLLWRKDAKKKKTRSPWQEWGAILTGAQLYFFRNTAWVKNLMHQLESHIKQGHDGIPVTFKPPLDQFKPDALMSTDNSVALLDSTYKKHKHAFVFVRHGGFEETLLADNEDEMNDWLAKLNYAAAFRTSGVRMRGVVGGHYEGQRSRGIRRLGSNSGSAKSVHTPTGDVTIVSGKIDTKMAQDILAARREIMLQKITEAEEKLAIAQRQLDIQLRNARHLQILAPIQVKTREHLVLAAGRMAAQLKWGRMEIWRLKCHRDILLLDLNDEKGTEGVSLRGEVGNDVGSDRATITRLNSRASAVPHPSPRSPPTATSTRPSTSTYSTPQLEKEHGLEDIFQSPPLSGSSSFHRSQASWELPPLNFDIRVDRGPRKTSFSSILHSSPKLAPATPRLGTQSDTASETQRPSSSSHVDAAEHAVLEEAGLIEVDKGQDRRPSVHPEVDEGRDKVVEKDKLERGKIRRSLHRTLRDTHVPSHSRSRKGKETSPSIGVSDEGAAEDVLSRGTGSFVVHGKKASVITFGSELQNLSPEERLRIRKQARTDEAGTLSPPPMDDDYRSALADPTNFRERHGSAATASTATGLSILDLDRRVFSQNLTVPVFGNSDGEDSEAAISVSEGRHTPLLSPVEDADENDIEDEDSRLDGVPKQATIYTPEENTTPVNATFDESMTGSPEREETIEPEYDTVSTRMASPPPQTAVGA